MPRKPKAPSSKNLPAVVEREAEAVLAPSANLDVRLFALAIGTLSKSTQKAYAQDIRRFGEWWGKTDPLAALIRLSAGKAREVVLNYQAHMVRRKLSTNTVARAIRSLNSIVGKLHFAEKVSWTLDIPVKKPQPYKEVQGPGQQAWQDLIDFTASQQRWMAVRDTAVFRLLGNDGLRAGEVGKLMYPSDVREDNEDGTVEVFVQGKGDKDVWHPIHPKTWESLQRWLEVRIELLETEEGPLFFSAQGNPLSGHAVWQRVTHRAQQAGLDHIHPHELRHHAITTRARRWTGPHAALVEWARHDDPRTTQVYIDGVGKETRQVALLGDDDDDD